MTEGSNSTRKWVPAAEAAVNTQINAELEANYAYLALAQYFDRDDVALKNISNFFKKCAAEEMEHAQHFINYQNRRGGTVKFTPIQPYNVPSPFSAKQAFIKAKELEEHVYDVLLKLHDSSPCDPEFQDEVASEFLHEQVKAISELKSYITNLELVGDKLGVYVFDKEFTKT